MRELIAAVDGWYWRSFRSVIFC